MTLSTFTATPSSTGGTLPAGSRYYQVTVVGPNGAESMSPGEAAPTVAAGGTGSVTVTWSAVAGAQSYRPVYVGTATHQEDHYFTVVGTSFTDTGAAGTAGSPPSGPPHADSRDLVLDPTATAGSAGAVAGALFNANDGGIYRLTLSGTRRWTNLNAAGPLGTGLRITQLLSVAYDPLNGVLLGGAQDNGISLQSTTASNGFDDVVNSMLNGLIDRSCRADRVEDADRETATRSPRSRSTRTRTARSTTSSTTCSPTT